MISGPFDRLRNFEKSKNSKMKTIFESDSKEEILFK